MNMKITAYRVLQFQGRSTGRGLGCPVEDVWRDKHCEGEDEVGVPFLVRGVLPRPRGEQPHQVHHQHQHHRHQHQHQHHYHLFH